jgi:hypothetical protein
LESGHERQPEIPIFLKAVVANPITLENVWSSSFRFILNARAKFDALK